MYYDLADCIVIMYDVTNKDSFNDVDAWLSSVKDSNRHHEIFLVGNKIDKAKDRVMAKKFALQYAYSKKMHFNEISVINSNMTNELLEKITSHVLMKEGKGGRLPQTIPRQEKVCGGCNVI